MVQGVLGGAELGHEVLGRLTGEDRLVCPSPKLGGLVPWRVWLQVDRAKLSQVWFTFRIMVRRPLRDPLRKTNRKADLCLRKKTPVLQRFLASPSGVVPGPMPPAGQPTLWDPTGAPARWASGLFRGLRQLRRWGAPRPGPGPSEGVLL